MNKDLMHECFLPEILLSFNMYCYKAGFSCYQLMPKQPNNYH